MRTEMFAIALLLIWFFPLNDGVSFGRVVMNWISDGQVPIAYEKPVEEES